jgi:hypothetical protein
MRGRLRWAALLALAAAGALSGCYYDPYTGWYYPYPPPPPYPYAGPPPNTANGQPPGPPATPPPPTNGPVMQTPLPPLQ